MKKEVELEKNNAVALGNVSKLLVETARCNECAQEERRAKEDARTSLKELNVQHQELILSKNTLERELQGKCYCYRCPSRLCHNAVQVC